MDVSNWPIEPAGIAQLIAAIGLLYVVADAMMGNGLTKRLTGMLKPAPPADPIDPTEAVEETRAEQIVADDAALMRLYRRAERLENNEMRASLDRVSKEWMVHDDGLEAEPLRE